MIKIRRICLSLIPIFIYFFFVSCEKDLTPIIEKNPQLQLTAEDVGVTETWIRIKIVQGTPDGEDCGLKNTITVARNDSVILKLNASTQWDTVFYHFGLLPKHDYTYKATLTADSPRRGR